MELLRYIDGDYEEFETFTQLKKALGGAERPAHYLAIPPTLFGTVVEHLAAAGCAPAGARVIVEKPFGRDLASARALNRMLLKNFDEERDLPHRPLSRQEPGAQHALFPVQQFAARAVFGTASTSRAFRSRWPRTSASRGGARSTTRPGRSATWSKIICSRCLSNLAMEPPARTDSESIRDEKVKVLKSIRALGPDDLVRGQFRGYREENGVAPDSQVETFAAVRLTIDSWRWQGVPFYIRSGKLLPVTCTEMVARLRRPPAILYERSGTNHLRFRIGPTQEIAIGLNVMDPEETGTGRRQSSSPAVIPGRTRRDAYERVLSDALLGDRTLFAREDYVEEAWRIVDPVLAVPTPLQTYEPGTWGPTQSSAVTPPGGWVDPIVTGEGR